MLISSIFFYPFFIFSRTVLNFIVFFRHFTIVPLIDKSISSIYFFEFCCHIERVVNKMNNCIVNYLCDTDLSLARLMYMKADTFWNEVDVQYYAKFPSFIESGRSVNVAGYHCKPYYCKPAPNFRKDICICI